MKIGAKLNDEEKAQIGLSKMERRAQRPGSVPEAVFRLPGTPQKNGSVHADPSSSGECRLRQFAFPEILEASFANRECYQFRDSEEAFPTAIDQPNSAPDPDLFLGRFQF